MSVQIRQISYSTEGIAAEDRHHEWVTRSERSMIDYFSTEPLYPFFSSSSATTFAGNALVHIEIAGQRWTRDARLIAEKPADALVFNVSVNIDAYGEMSSTVFHQTPGCGVFLDLSQPSTHVSTSGRSINITVPRLKALAAGIDPVTAHGLVVDPSATLAVSALATWLQATLATMKPDDVVLADKTLLNMLTLLTRSTKAVGPGVAKAVRSNLSLVARDQIGRSLGSPSLSVAKLCRQLGVSRSTLHRAFLTEGGVANYIRVLRLAHARLVLADQGSTERIFDIAERFGFADSAHFSRVFRAEFGQSPSEYRFKTTGIGKLAARKSQICVD